MRTLLVLALLALSHPAAAQNILGTATAVDGDTLEMTGQRLRLTGIDAPELEQKCRRDGADWDCGAQARRHLNLLLQGVEVHCTVTAQDVQGIDAASCQAAGRDLSEAMVEAGLAVAVQERSGDAPYADAEQRVKAGRSGIWAGSFESPSDWRKAHPRARLAARTGAKAQASARSTGSSGQKVYRNAFGCAIKGNVSQRNGEYIYYLPGMNYYDGTRPERLFCTEEEAQAAGFRRSRGG